jgi:pyruvate dehydrogenase E2 component (dihydrolipoamide acetyltransferase)
MRAFSLPFHTKLEMPNLSPTMETVNIKSWNKKVGDSIAPGDVLCAIETDKATMDYEMQEEGFIAKICYPEGEKDIALGRALAIMVDSESDIAAFANWSEDADAAPVAEAAPAQQAAPVQAAAPEVNYPWHVLLEMPNLSPTMETGNIKTWGKEVGDSIAPGDVLCSIETDKATMDYEM